MAGKPNHALVSALLSAFCSLILIWGSSVNPAASQTMVDAVGKMLYLPEMPALELRNLVQAASNWVMERKSLQDRNKELELENMALRSTLARGSVELPQTGGDLLGARVTLRYPDAWWKEVRIDRGTEGGVTVGAPAFSDGHLIGRVSSAGSDYAWIELVTSSSFMLAAVVEETWDLGVVRGDDMGNIWLLYTPPEKEYERGMTVSTALVGDYLPPGIPIGKIWGPGELRDGFMPRRIASGAHLTQLYNVQILRRGGSL